MTDKPKPLTSTITHCYFMARKNTIFYSKAGGPAMFQENPTGDGSLFVTLENMLVAPLELFSQRQLRAFSRKLKDMEAPRDD